MQEAFARTWERWDRVRRMENPAGYVYRIGVNHLSGVRRRLLRVASASRLVPHREVEPFAEADERDAVVRALRSITPRQRAAIVLTEYLGYEAASAASIIRVKPVTIRVLCSQARAALHRSLGSSDE